jgi:ABC-2 type transport system ATP-binding protein
MSIASTTAQLSAVDLVKTYSGGRSKPAIRALDGLSISVRAGTVHALLGPNGAGKSTTVKILCTLARPDSGRATVAGIDVARHPDAVRRAIGLVSQKSSSDPMATARENLVLTGRIQGLGRAEAAARAVELLDRFGLSEAADRVTRAFSGGMTRKLDVAIGLVHRPQVLFLDEPTAGLDPQARSELWAEIGRLAALEQVTVLLTTHYLDEADRLADQVSIVDHGRVVVHGTPEQLKSQLHGDTVLVELASAQAVPAALTRLARVSGLSELGVDPGIGQTGAAGSGAAGSGPAGSGPAGSGPAGSGPAGSGTVRARAVSGARAVPAVLAALEEAGIEVASVSVARPSLDDVYLRFAGRKFEAAA